MPIRLNLLAEAQAAEEMRRRDPVKRALWLAALIIALILVWSSYLQLRATLANSDVTRAEAQMGSRTNEFQQILDNQKKTGEIDGRLRLLRQLAGNRFLNGTLLNTFQQTTVEDVQLIRLRVEQLYTVFEGTKTRTNDDNVVSPGRLPTDTEKTVVNLEGIDSSSNPGNQVNRFQRGPNEPVGPQWRGVRPLAGCAGRRRPPHLVRLGQCSVRGGSWPLEC